MITADMYRSHLNSYGSNLAHVKQNQSNMVVNSAFTADAQYKRVYILTKDGWKFEDAKFQKHAKYSILKDAVDYYVQFRPKVHYSVGSYLFIPDDTAHEINIHGKDLEDPLSLPEDQITQLWFIVGRDYDPSFVRYNVLQCNWKFKWIYNNKLYTCWGANRSANSYTSGKWTDFVCVFCTYMVRCKGKPCSVFFRICWKPQSSTTLQHKDEIRLYVNAEKFVEMYYAR